MTGKQNRILKNLLNQLKKNKNVMAEIVSLIKHSGGIEYAQKQLDSFSYNALEAVKSYPESDVKESMINLVLFNKNRSS